MVRHRPDKNKGADNSDRVFSDKKVNYFATANKLFDEYNKILVVSNDNVQSSQMQSIRIALRGQAIVLMGKNTTMKKVLLDRLASGSAKDEMIYSKLVKDGLLKLNVGLIFTNGDLNDVKDVIDKCKIQAPARQGSVAPLDVTIPAGNTGLEPTKTSFFQTLNINTKITKGTVEILKDEPVIKAGDRVGSSEATLLGMLGIKPFFYGMEIVKIYDNGEVYTRKALEMTDDDMKKMLEGGIANVTGVSLATGITTQASIPHVMMNAFKEMLAVTVGSDYVMESCNGAELREAILSGKGLGGPAPAAAAAAPAEEKKEEKKVVEEEEEEDDDMGFGLFD
jgi:large subunit ribosomal protein LP0|uniref:Large ribosomal subunit protein uL10-like insertion domain-containing protein n=1 Tax=Eutreptiella gymnastica TaxID=73025 RepID=A0A7S4LCB5_9EUGL